MRSRWTKTIGLGLAALMAVSLVLEAMLASY